MDLRTVLHILLALAAVIAVGRILARLFKTIHQPPVIGEVLAGILLGPSLLGRIAPGAFAFLLPASIVPGLNAVAQAGVIVYLFLVGLELNPDRLRARARTSIAISQASIVAPFVLGALLALYLYPRLSSTAVPFTTFTLFMGIAMSITAFPVLARILSDRGMTDSELGAMALTCAAVDDVTAWCLLAFVVGVAQDRPENAAVVALLTAGFIATMVLVVRPFVARFARRAGERPGPAAIAAALAGLAVSTFTTERIGIHALFGAFFFGALIPHDSGIARSLLGRLKGPVTFCLLPAFFALAGMRTRIDLLSSVSAWLTCGLIILVATAGKFGGAFAAARLTGMGPVKAAGLGVLMNTRGLMELIVLNIGLDLGVISPALFTMMVLMALVTTIATTPLLDLLAQTHALQSSRVTEAG
jgi:Kef-type K+ transport system membrane component KefB